LVVSGTAGGLGYVALLGSTRFDAVFTVLATVALFSGSIIPMVDATVIDHLAALGGDYGRLRVWGSIGFIAGAVGSAPFVARFSPAVVPAILVVPAVLLGPTLALLPRGQHGDALRVRAPWRLVSPPLAAFLASAFLLQVSLGAWSGFFAVHTA